MLTFGASVTGTVNSELEALDIISNFQMTDENHITKLLSVKNSINDELRKVRELDDTVIFQSRRN